MTDLTRRRFAELAGASLLSIAARLFSSSRASQTRRQHAHANNRSFRADARVARLDSICRGSCDVAHSFVFTGGLLRDGIRSRLYNTRYRLNAARSAAR